ncbi:hypothetical protein KXD40_000674 [Peronospora effusa]|uniref:Uncharacterized protein n=1 Tax=Peronospora effusa TaxID=542832 RepID=A0A3M6VIQ3_9STRA|nr:hypothetical protein DD238_004597 [Peronospora effusa]RQM14980.1 hypothetical protein DD237_005009 [Peronospora effusa]UIZ21298.1 hypothetical protein KXD40_000674 [Peronospora effusa]
MDNVDVSTSTLPVRRSEGDLQDQPNRFVSVRPDQDSKKVLYETKKWGITQYLHLEKQGFHVTAM